MSDERAIEQEIQDKGLTAPRLTPEMIDGLIAGEYWGRASDMLRDCPMQPNTIDRLTICILVLKNGFVVTGTSACVDVANYDADLGYKIARANAREQIWPLAGYALREKLAGG